MQQQPSSVSTLHPLRSQHSGFATHAAFRTSPLILHYDLLSSPSQAAARLITQHREHPVPFDSEAFSVMLSTVYIEHEPTGFRITLTGTTEHPIRVIHILEAICTYFAEPINRAHPAWQELSHSRRARIRESFNRRIASRPDPLGCIRRVDYLEGATRFAWIVVRPGSRNMVDLILRYP